MHMVNRRDSVLETEVLSNMSLDRRCLTLVNHRRDAGSLRQGLSQTRIQRLSAVEISVEKSFLVLPRPSVSEGSGIEALGHTSRLSRVSRAS